MTPRDILEANPIFRRMRDRDRFVATHRVTLQHWSMLDEASWWCEERWREDELHSRRRVFADRHEAEFEFSDFDEAALFLLRFGKHCCTL